jgi:subtilisin family serine protease
VRQLVVLPDHGKDASGAGIQSALGLKVMSSDEWSGQDERLAEREAVIFRKLGIALIYAEPLLISQSSMLGHSEIEGQVALFDSPPGCEIAPAGACVADSALEAWGLQATAVIASNSTGANVRVCVMDTGVDFTHPDLANKNGGPAKAFGGATTIHDSKGHGTHCAGIVCGMRTAPPPATVPEPWRYSVAPPVELAVARVFNGLDPRVPEGRIVAALDWAVQNHCAVVSMAFGFVWPGTGYSIPIETAVQNALAAGTVVIAGTGNVSVRPNFVHPTFHPARCPTVVAVGAVDFCDRLSKFSNGAVPGKGGKVDIVGPGEGVYSAWLHKSRFPNRGTSMATAFVAGIAALHKSANPSMSGAALRSALLSRVKTLPYSADDVGRGLALAP